MAWCFSKVWMSWLLTNRTACLFAAKQPFPKNKHLQAALWLFVSFVTLRLCFHEVNVAKLSPTTSSGWTHQVTHAAGVWQEHKACEGRHAMPQCCELQKPEKRTKATKKATKENKNAVCFFLCFLCACVCILLGQGGLCLFMHLWVCDALRVYLEGCTLGKERIDCDTLLLPCFGGGSILNALWMAVHCSSLWTRFLHCTRIVSCSKDEMVYDLMNVRASQSDFGWAKLEIWRFL